MKFIYKITMALILINSLLVWGFFKGNELFVKAIDSSPQVQTFDQTKKLSFKYSALISNIQNAQNSYFLEQNDEKELNFFKNYSPLINFFEELSLDYGPKVTIESQISKVTILNENFTEIVNMTNKEFSLSSNLNDSGLELLNFIQKNKLKKSYIVTYYKLRNFEKEFLLKNNPEFSDLLAQNVNNTIQRLNKGRYSKKIQFIKLLNNYKTSFNSMLINRLKLKSLMDKSPEEFKRLNNFNFNTLLKKSDLNNNTSSSIPEKLSLFKKIYNIIGSILIFLILAISCVSLYILYGHLKENNRKMRQNKNSLQEKQFRPEILNIKTTEDIKVEIHPKKMAKDEKLPKEKSETPPIKNQQVYGPPMPMDMSITKMNENLFDINDQISSLRETSKRVQMLVDDNTDNPEKVS